jgi:nitrogen fixation/metabolism regulation signal transduction histidine kinase
MSKASRWAWAVSLVAAVGAALVLAFLLSVATNNPMLYERHFVWLFWVNVVVASLLFTVIGVTTVRLLIRIRRGKFGSRLLLKLAAIFALVGVVPGVLIYTVSYQFVSRSIESWFDAKVEGALGAGLNLGRGTLDALVQELAEKTRFTAERLAELPYSAQPLTLERVREQLAADDVAVLDASGQIQFTTSGSATNLLPERPASSLLNKARSGRAAAQLEGLDDETPSHSARVRALARLPSVNFLLDEQPRYLMVTQMLPRGLTTNALAVQAAYREYQQRVIARAGLRKMYIGTLTLSLVLAVFGALLLAVALGNQLVRPLLLLAEGMGQVASGDLSAKPIFASRDELGGLTKSFANMTEQLSEARALVQRGVTQLEGARSNLQTILDNLTAGVIVLDRQGRIDTVNPGATRILRLPLSVYRGQLWVDVPGLSDFTHPVWQRFQQHEASPKEGERGQWQDAFELTLPGHERETLTLLVRGAPMPSGPYGDLSLGARLLVFDDISEVVSAQRAEAWSEVARRLAHEIKNPLTPIQLSAERLQHKLESKLEGQDQAMLVRSVTTIVNQVQAMKTLVNEFRDYARLPAAQLKPLDLNALVNEVLTLYATAQESQHLFAELAPHLPEIIGDTTQLRQVIHNLVQNALDAVAEQSDGRVRVLTEAMHNEHCTLRSVRLQVIDNGPGFPDKVLKRAFEPYVTTKSKGTGLGLAVVKKIADEHRARVRITNLGGSINTADVAGKSGGAQVSLSFSQLVLSMHDDDTPVLPRGVPTT